MFGFSSNPFKRYSNNHNIVFSRSCLCRDPSMLHLVARRHSKRRLDHSLHINSLTHLINLKIFTLILISKGMCHLFKASLYICTIFSFLCNLLNSLYVVPIFVWKASTICLCGAYCSGKSCAILFWNFWKIINFCLYSNIRNDLNPKFTKNKCEHKITKWTQTHEKSNE